MSAIQCNVTSSILIVETVDNITTNSVKQFEVEFIFDEEWSTTLSVLCQFDNNELKKNVVIQDNKCIIPPDLLTDSQVLYLGVIGTFEDKTCTTNRVGIYLTKASCTSGDSFSSPTEWQQYTLIVSSLVEEAKDISEFVSGIAVSTPYIGENENWYVWDEESKSYVDSGEKATGDTGEQGIQGEKGEKGDTGEQGIQGEKGEKGDTGEQGVQGEKGDTGEQGIQGPQGEKGDTGTDGVGIVSVELTAHYDASFYSFQTEVNDQYYLDTIPEVSDIGLNIYDASFELIATDGVCSTLTIGSTNYLRVDSILSNLVIVRWSGNNDTSPMSIYTITLTDGSTSTFTVVDGIDGATGDKGEKGDTGVTGPQGDAFTYDDFTDEQLADLKGEKGDTGDTPSLDNYYDKDETEALVSGIKGIASLTSLSEDLEDYTGTTLEFIAAIKTAGMEVGSMAIGGVSLSDLPGGMDNGEITVVRMSDTVTNLMISSVTTSPYQWFCNHWNAGMQANICVWRSYVDDVEASNVTFDDGDTFQDKYDSGELKGDTGIQGTDFPYEVLTQTEYDALEAYEDKLYVIADEV